MIGSSWPTYSWHMWSLAAGWGSRWAYGDGVTKPTGYDDGADLAAIRDGVAPVGAAAVEWPCQVDAPVWMICCAGGAT